MQTQFFSNCPKFNRIKFADFNVSFAVVSPETAELKCHQLSSSKTIKTEIETNYFGYSGSYCVEENCLGCNICILILFGGILSLFWPPTLRMKRRRFLRFEEEATAFCSSYNNLLKSSPCEKARQPCNVCTRRFSVEFRS